MASKLRVSISFCFLIVSLLTLLSSRVMVSAEEEEAEVKSPESVLTLDHTNFHETISKHSFIVVEFYAPWCGHCKDIAPRYEKAASILSSQDPPIILAKVDASDEANKGIADEFKIEGFPTIKILRDGGKDSQEYKGPREAYGIVEYLKKQVGPPSTEIKSAQDASTLINDKNIFLVGIFPKFSGEEFENFTILAKKLRSDYDFGHTLDAKLVPRGDAVSGPTIRLLKPFDEPFVDFQDFHVETLEKFVEQATVPLVTVYDEDESNFPYLEKYFNSPNAKAMLFVKFSDEHADGLKSKFRDAAENNKGKGLNFLVGDLEASKDALEYFGLKQDQAPLVFIQAANGEKYLKSKLEADHIAPWFKEYMDGKAKPFKKSEPIPDVNDEPVKVVVGDNIHDFVFNSAKNVLLEFCAPWCGHCKELAPILDEVAVSFQTDTDVVIAKIDATANDFPTKTFDVEGFPTMYFKSSTGDLVKYDGGRTKEDIINFINKNKDTTVKQEESVKDVKQEESVKDEL